MAKLLFRLRNVPEDEAEGIRALLAEHRFETFETSGGLFQISMPAIWLVHDSDFATARSVLDQWQAERLEAVRSQASPTISLWQRLKQSPVRFTLLWLAIVVVASLSTWPFWQFFVRT
jgi:hypothetical protein